MAVGLVTTTRQIIHMVCAACWSSMLQVSIILFPGFSHGEELGGSTLEMRCVCQIHRASRHQEEGEKLNEKLASLQLLYFSPNVTSGLSTQWL